MTEDQAGTSRRPPAIIWTAFAFVLLFGLVSLVGTALLIKLHADGRVGGGGGYVANIVISVVVGGALILAAIFLLRRAAWARWLAIGLLGLNLLLALLTVAAGGLSLPNIVLPALGLVLLFRKETIAWINEGVR